MVSCLFEYSTSHFISAARIITEQKHFICLQICYACFLKIKLFISMVCLLSLRNISLLHVSDHKNVNDLHLVSCFMKLITSVKTRIFVSDCFRPGTQTQTFPIMTCMWSGFLLNLVFFSQGILVLEGEEKMAEMANICCIMARLTLGLPVGY